MIGFRIKSFIYLTGYRQRQFLPAGYFRIISASQLSRVPTIIDFAEPYYISHTYLIFKIINLLSVGKWLFQFII